MKTVQRGSGQCHLTPAANYATLCAAAGRAAWLALLLWTPAALGQSCRVDVVPVNFGAYDPARARPSLTRGEIAISCSQGDDSTLAPQVRLRLSGPAQRQLQGGGMAMRYSLFQDADLQRPWWDGAPLELAPKPGDGRNSGVRAPVHALLPPGQWVQPGEYRDLVQLSVEF
ncbi:spore coat protein U domain-containing protein [Tahibacter harae]|uniref:Spore coat U domain-containing protein n=1 Tax=Tahibacter harae TaxID=2963937 RepID=A0ABT1QNR8_9GAMM|nr:spore coat protein U domain-containing protein [Tahibacter harae]MCQ4163773.1 spore coat U domain-containing protein [Tahibacter harae]